MHDQKSNLLLISQIDITENQGPHPASPKYDVVTLNPHIDILLSYMGECSQRGNPTRRFLIPIRVKNLLHWESLSIAFFAYDRTT